MKLSNENMRDDDILKVRFKVKNIGETAGAEVCQLYVGSDTPKIFKAKKELKEFTKVFLKAGEEKEITFTLNKSAFAYYNVQNASFEVETGRYTVYIGDSLTDLPLQKQLRVTNTTGVPSADYSNSAPCYYGANIENGVSDAAFTAIYGSDLPPKQRPEGERPNVNYTFDDLTDTRGGRFVRSFVAKGASLFIKGSSANKKMTITMLMESPLRASVLMSSGRFTFKMADDVLLMSTGHFWKGFFKLIYHTIFKKNNKQKEVIQ